MGSDSFFAKRESDPQKRTPWLLRFDPGYASLRNAFRGTLALLISFLLSGALAAHLGLAPTASFVGAMIAMLQAMGLSDPGRRAQQVSLGWVHVAACLALSASILLSPFLALRLAGFFLTAFVAVALRQTGPRGTAIGSVAFMSYFMPIFFPATIADVPVLLAAVTIASLSTFVLRFVILPDRPRRVMRLLICAYELKLAEICALSADALSAMGRQAPASESLALRRQVRAQLAQLSELALTIEQNLTTTHFRPLRLSADALILQVFEHELRLRRFLDVLLAWIPSATPSDLHLAAQAIRQSPARGTPAFSPTFPAPELTREWNAFLARPPLSLEASGAQASIHPIPAALAPRDLGLPQLPRHLNAYRQAIQCTLAVALASAAGFMISHVRWYWAPLASFVLFVGASRGDTFVRAGMRVLGTMGGLLIGHLVVESLAGHPRLEWSAITLCIFLAMFGARLAFGFWTTAMFSVMIVALFDELGRLSSQLLVLRLEETLVGALIGAGVGAWVLPISTRRTVRQALAKPLRTLAEICRSLAESLAVPTAVLSPRNLVQQLRQVDRELLAARTAAAPLRWRLPGTRREALSEAVYDVTALTTYIRHVATRPPLTDPRAREIVARFGFHYAASARVLADHIEADHPAAPAQLAKLEGPDKSEYGSIDPTLARWLERIGQLLVDLARRSDSASQYETGPRN